MPLKKPNHGEVVWIEYPEGKHFQAEYDAADKTNMPAVEAAMSRLQSARAMQTAATAP